MADRLLEQLHSVFGAGTKGSVCRALEQTKLNQTVLQRFYAFTRAALAQGKQSCLCGLIIE